MEIAFIIIALVLIFIAVILIRTLAFTPRKNVETEPQEIKFNKERAVKNLQSLIRFKTVSYYDKEKEENAEFQGLIDALPTLYPKVFEICELSLLPDRAILLCWKGKQQGDPTVLMSHYDVVYADEKSWEKPPFEGVIEDGVLWGRGTLDTKVTMNAALSAAEELLENGFTPEKDIYFAFSGGEEVNGEGALRIVEYFKEKGIHPEMVIDEGGAVVQNVFPGVKEPCGLIGIAEKGFMNVRYTADSSGGHASAPKPGSPIPRLAKACLELEKKPFKKHITKPVREMFDTLGRHSSFIYKMIFANLWCFSGILDMIAKKSGGEMNALLRTTVAFTQSQGSPAPNVIPTNACLVSNMRLNPEDSVDGALKYLTKTVNDSKIKIELLESVEPSTISETDCKAWQKISTAVASTWKGSIVSPYLMVQCSDSRHYNGFCSHVYRFSAMDLSSEERATIHGNNERIRLECIHRSVEFYIRLIKKC